MLYRISLWLLIFFSFPSGAKPTKVCSHFYGYDEVKSISEWLMVYENRLSKLLFSETSPSGDLEFHWHFPFPEEKKMQGAVDLNSHKSLVYQRSAREEKNRPLSVQKMSTAMATFSSRALVNAFLSNYHGEISAKEHDFVRELESILEVLADDRQGFGYVASGRPEHGGRILGTFRVFNGTPKFSRTLPLMPMEYFARLKGLKFKKLNLDKMRNENPNRQMFEIGKHSIFISPPHDLSLSKKVKEILDLFYLRNYVENVPPDSLFFLNTWNPDMVMVGQNRYGLKLAEVIENPADGTSEYYMMGTAGEIANYMREKYKMPAINESLEFLRMMGLPNIDGRKFILDLDSKD